MLARRYAIFKMSNPEQLFATTVKADAEAAGAAAEQAARDKVKNQILAIEAEEEEAAKTDEQRAAEKAAAEKPSTSAAPERPKPPVAPERAKLLRSIAPATLRAADPSAIGAAPATFVRKSIFMHAPAFSMAPRVPQRKRESDSPGPNLNPTFAFAKQSAPSFSMGARGRGGAFDKDSPTRAIGPGSYDPQQTKAKVACYSMGRRPRPESAKKSGIRPDPGAYTDGVLAYKAVGAQPQSTRPATASAWARDTTVRCEPPARQKSSVPVKSHVVTSYGWP